MRFAVIFLAALAIVGWVFAFDSESRYQCAKDANAILTMMVFAVDATLTYSETPDGIQADFTFPDGQVHTLVYPAHCRDLNKTD